MAPLRTVWEKKPEVLGSRKIPGKKLETMIIYSSFRELCSKGKEKNKMAAGSRGTESVKEGRCCCV